MDVESIQKTNLIGDAEIHPESLAQMRQAGGTWAVYQNHDFGSPDLGRLKFMRVGSECTFSEAPARLPDMPDQINWAYVYAGMVDLEKGVIVE